MTVKLWLLSLLISTILPLIIPKRRDSNQPASTTIKEKTNQDGFPDVSGTFPNM